MDKKKDAKTCMLKKLSDEMKGMMREGYDDSDLGKKLMKVTVAAKDKEGLEEGLSKAEEIMKGRMGDEMIGEEMAKDYEEMDEESEESSEMAEMDEESEDSEEMEKEELLKKIAELEKKLEDKEA